MSKLAALLDGTLAPGAYRLQSQVAVAELRAAAEARGARCFYLDGHTIHDKATFLAACAAAFALPAYFGHNWDALSDCLTDVDSDVVLLVHDASNLFHEAPYVATNLIEVWLAAAQTSAVKIQLVFVW